LPEGIDYRAKLFNGVPGLGPGLGFDHCQRWLEVLGLQTPTRVAAQLAHKQPLGFIVSNIVIALLSPRAVSLSQFFPAVGRIDCAAKLLGIHKSLDPHYRMLLGNLPVAA
jgi:hypothetical protein